MTPKEKSEELLDKMVDNYYTCTALVEINRRQAKRCAKIAVEEILEILRSFASVNKRDYDYWVAVKQEIFKSEN